MTYQHRIVHWPFRDRPVINGLIFIAAYFTVLIGAKGVGWI